MLISSTCPVTESFFLATLGSSCHYIISKAGDSNAQSLVLFDPGTSMHAHYLLHRASDIGLSPANIHEVYITHLHPERVSGIPYLRKMYPKVRVYGSQEMTRKLNQDYCKYLYEEDVRFCLKLGFKSEHDFSESEYTDLMRVDHIIKDTDTLNIGEFSVKPVSAPGHSPESLFYYILPLGYMICDEGAGYYNGASLAGPGGDESLEKNIATIKKLKDLDIHALCLPFHGVLVGSLVSKQLIGCIQNTSDLISETSKALAEGVPKLDIISSIQTSFYEQKSTDLAFKESTNRSLSQILKQLGV